MGQVLHRSATTTEAVRRAIQHSQESLRVLARRHGINQKTVAKWRKRCSGADLPKNRKGPTARFRGHPFDRVCLLHGIDHRLTKPNPPWTNGQVERMNRTIKEATVQRYHYESHDQLRTHLSDFVAGYNFAKRFKTLDGLTAYEFICTCWQKEHDRFTLDPIHQMPGLYTRQLLKM